MLDSKFLELLCCPETRQPLQEANPELLEKLNQRIAAGGVLNRVGHAVGRRCDGGLIRGDGLYLYPIWDGIPVLLMEEAIPLDTGRVSSSPATSVS